MSGTPYNGLPANIAMPNAIAISSSTNTTPITVAATAHGCKTGDRVDVADHTVNTAANGIWTVTFVDANNVQLNGSVGNGVGGATGTLQPIAFTGNVSLNPANGDPYDASTYIPGMSCLADRTAFNLGNTGTVKIASVGFASFSGALNPAAIAGNWAPVATFGAFSPPLVEVITGDLIEWDVFGSYSGFNQGANNDLFVAPDISIFLPGGSPTFSNATVIASQQVQLTSGTSPAAPSGLFYPFSLNAITLVTGGTVAALNFAFRSTTTATNIILGNAFTFRWRVFRGTGVPQ